MKGHERHHLGLGLWSSKPLLVLLVAFCAGVSAAEGLDKELWEKQLEWVVGKGGYWNPKQEYRRKDPDDPNSYMGIFATDTIAEDEALFSVPWTCIISDPNDSLKQVLTCRTIRKFIDEMRKFRQGQQTEFEPFLAFLNSREPLSFPSSWADSSKRLLAAVTGYGQLPPEDPFKYFKDWKQFCMGDPTNTTEHEGVMALLLRGEDNRIVPIYDMYNHRNGDKYFNTVTILDKNVRQGMKAAREIKAGEEIYGSYNFCSNCGPYRQSKYGTPEILGDYGFVENYPQRWIFHKQKFGFDLEKDEKEGTLEVKWLDNNDYEVSDRGIALMKQHINRLNGAVLPHLKQIETKLASEGDHPDLPPKAEFETVLTYCGAMIVAMEQAIKKYEADEHDNAKEGAEDCPGGYLRKGQCVLATSYDALTEKTWKYKRYQRTCDNSHVFKYADYEENDFRSAYQKIQMYVQPENKDVCMELETTMQICSCYRPHYHEYMAHVAARYKPEIKRAVFVGGGDSMLLHEMLKYEDIELVLGLELDQLVVRQSFKFFRTQPHFDDPRVEWWFGDATKSLLMLPKDYFGTFDLVLVDLSETVVAFSVSEHLNIIEALTLLLKKDGIFVKNEQYFKGLSQLFDYTVQVYFPDLPKICDQFYAIGSNTIDFMNPDVDTLKKHNVEMLLLEPITHEADRYDHLHCYRKNDAREQGKCVDLKDDFKLQAGVMMLLEAENISLESLDWDTIGPKIVTMLEEEKLRIKEATWTHKSGESEVGIILMKEGIVSARMFPKEKYCAFDIYLWGRYTRMEGIKEGLAKVVGSESLSSYRVIVGGMKNAGLWKKDKKTVGPVIKNNRDCSKESKKEFDTLTSSDDLVESVLEESLSLFQRDEDDPILAVLCGDREVSCMTMDLVKKLGTFEKVTPLYACPEISSVMYRPDGSLKMFECETAAMVALREGVKEHGGKFTAIVVDPGVVPIEMLKVMQSILSFDLNLNDVIAEGVHLVAPLLDEEETWRRAFLDRVLQKLDQKSLFRAEINVEGKEGRLELGVVAADPKFFLNVKNTADAIAARTGASTEVRKVVGGQLRYQHDYNPRNYPFEDYDPAPAIEQYNEQRPLGQQTILQLDIESSSKWKSIPAEVKEALEKTFTKWTDLQIHTHDEIGDGVILVALAEEGSGIAVWDGKDRCTISIFTYANGTSTSTKIGKRLAKKLNADVLANDDQPRGVGRVINLPGDITEDE